MISFGEFLETVEESNRGFVSEINGFLAEENNSFIRKFPEKEMGV